MSLSDAYRHAQEAQREGRSLHTLTGHDPQVDHGDAWREDTWADELLRRHEKQRERKAGGSVTTDQFTPAFYSRANKVLLALAQRDRDDLIARWQDEASEAALAGNPAKAGYIESHWIRRFW